MQRLFVFLAAVLLFSSSVFAQAPSCSTAGTNNPFLGIETINLWPGAPPESHGSGCYDIPTLTVFPALKWTANGSAVVIFPGGGYEMLSASLEGREVADWFTAHGFTAFIVAYRLPSHGYLLPVPLIDARRAIQTVRAHAAEYHIQPDRIVAVGFSAGGHLAALAATKPAPGDANASDPVERVSSRPDYLVLGYPWIDAVTPDTAHLSYCKLFNLMKDCDALRAKYTPTFFVNKQTPPTFIYVTFDDGLVPMQQSMNFFDALMKANVPSEMHVFAHGHHGTGLGDSDPALGQWPRLLEAWLRGHGLLDRAAAAGEKP